MVKHRLAVHLTWCRGCNLRPRRCTGVAWRMRAVRLGWDGSIPAGSLVIPVRWTVVGGTTGDSGGIASKERGGTAPVMR